MELGDKIAINTLVDFRTILEEKGKAHEVDFHEGLAYIFKKVLNEEIETSYIDKEDLILNDVKSHEEGVLSALSINYSEYVHVAFTHNLSYAKIFNFRHFIDEYLMDLARC